MLSTVLGYTQGRGNTRAEVIDYLTRSAGADGTYPTGTIYFAKNGDIRSKTRDGAFQDAVEQLRELDVRAEIVEGTLPKDKPDVQGLMTGTAYFNWKKSGNTILPGAICENLTSWGGTFDPKLDQTPLSVFLRHGAAGSSGTVFEPYAIAAKFPTASVQVQYARGCTLAEAFYQSVAGPYQLLIVGDPLCRPWAKIPTVKIEGVSDGETVKGTLRISASADCGDATEAAGFELFIDGRRVAVSKEGRLEFDTTILPDGYHELRVVGFEPGPVRSQGRSTVTLHTANHGRNISVSVTPKDHVDLAETITVEANCPGATHIGIFHNTQPVGRINAEAGKTQIAARTLGIGPVRLDVIGFGKGGPEVNALAEPVFLQVEEKAEPEEPTDQRDTAGGTP